MDRSGPAHGCKAGRGKHKKIEETWDPEPKDMQRDMCGRAYYSGRRAQSPCFGSLCCSNAVFAARSASLPVWLQGQQPLSRVRAKLPSWHRDWEYAQPPG